MNETHELNVELIRQWKESQTPRMTALRLAIILGVSTATVGRILAGRIPEWVTVEALAKLMRVDPWRDLIRAKESRKTA